MTILPMYLLTCMLEALKSALFTSNQWAILTVTYQINLRYEQFHLGMYFIYDKTRKPCVCVCV